MQKGRHPLLIILLLLLVPSFMGAVKKEINKRPVAVILDTDIGPDVDDAGCVATLHPFADNGEARILGMMCNTTAEWGAPCLDAFNTYYGRPDIPVGTLKGEGTSGDAPEWFGYAYNKYIVTYFPNDLTSGKNAPDAAILYRKLIASQPDKSVVIISVGALTNLRNLLITKPDPYSRLSGLELVRKKVKLLSLMAGGYPKGKENDPNFPMDLKASMKTIKDWPSPIVFSGVEIGERIKTGAPLIKTEEKNPIREAYIRWDSHFWRKWEPDKYKERSIHEHNSYDQTSVVFAIRGSAGLWDLSENGINTVYPNGSNEWIRSKTGRHRFLIQKIAPEEIGQLIDSLMVQKPSRMQGK